MNTSSKITMQWLYLGKKRHASMNRDLVADEELSCNALEGILQNTIIKTLLNGHQCLTLT